MSGEPASMHRGWERAICVATGPSLTAAQCERAARARAAGWRVIAINDAWRLTPSADVLHAGDAAWWEMHGASVVASFAGERWTLVRPLVQADYRKAERFGLHTVECQRGKGLSGVPGVVRDGGNSGHVAIQLAYFFGARIIVLIGFDMQKTGGRAHFFGDHPKGLNQPNDYRDYLPAFVALARDLEPLGVRVVNASAATALTCFDRMPLEAALSLQEATA